MNEKDLLLLLAVFVIIGILLLLYFTPSIIAFTRGHHYRWVIFAVNAVAGVTILGYVIAFAWSVWPEGTSFSEPFVGDPTSGDVDAGRQSSQRRGEYRQAYESGEQWYVAEGGQVNGPLSRQDLIQHVARGGIGRDTLVWREGLSQWTPVNSVIRVP